VRNDAGEGDNGTESAQRPRHKINRARRLARSLEYDRLGSQGTVRRRVAAARRMQRMWRSVGRKRKLCDGSSLDGGAGR
jgi:hypothetical protein